MKKICFLVLAAFGLASAQTYKDAKQPIEKRIDDLLSKMTLEEKVAQLSGDGISTKPNERLGIPGFEMSDGPLGVRIGKATAFPAGVAMASSWDTSLIAKVAKAIAIEGKGKGLHFILGPTVNIHRLPTGGRNFESYSEDPYLASRMAVSYVKGIQNEKLAVSVKHFCCNDQEWERMRVDALIDERTMHEIHLPMFKAAVTEAGALCLMSAYNKINGKYAGENSYLLTDVLKKQWNFQGFVISDWEATHSTVPSAKAGLDLEMPTGVYFGDSLTNAVKSNKVTMAELEDKVRRVLRVKFKLGMFEEKRKANESLVNTPETQKLALESATKGMVLLKNANTLPLDKSKLKSIAVIGPNAAIARTGAGGSSQVASYYTVTPLDAIKKKLGSGVKVNFAQGDVIDIKGLTVIDNKYLVSETGEQGLTAKYWDKKTLEESIEYKNTGLPVVQRVDKKLDFAWSDPDSPDSKIDKDYWVAEWSGKLKPPISRKYKIYTQTDDGIRVWFEDKLVIDNWDVHGPEKDSFIVDMEGFKTYKIRIEYFEGNMGAMVKLGWDLPEDGASTQNGDLIAQAVEAAKNSDIAIIFAGMSDQYESEGFDTKTGLKLPGKQDSLIMAVAKVNPKTIVCLTNGNPIQMPWLGQVAGVIEGWYSGQEVGNAFTNIIFGDANPSGKLTRTFIRKKEDSPAYEGYKASDITAKYTEGIYVGYRYFDKMNIEPLFPFGFGLSYTTYEYSNLSVKPGNNNVLVSLTVKNSGKVAGEEIVQLYIKDKVCSVDRPEKELKAFTRVKLNPGESRNVAFLLKNDDVLSFYDVKTKKFITEPGEFEIMIGASSRDIRLKNSFTLK
jgi:beta-glucosidase